MKRRFFMFSISAVLVCMAMISTFHETAFPSEHQASSQSPSSMNQVYQSRPQYQIKATYDEKKDQVVGHMVVTLPETRTEPQSHVYFHLYPNAFKDWKYGQESRPTKPGYIQISNLKVNGKAVKEDIKETVMKVNLPNPVKQGESARIAMDFSLQLPHGGTRLNTYKQTAFLAQWYPMLAVQDQEGWHTDPYTTTGDPFYTQMSDFDVTFHIPKGYQVISTGNNQGHEGKSQVTIKQDNVRDFAAVLTKDYEVIKGKSGKVQVNLWYLKGMEKEAPVLHEAAVSGMKYFSEIFGAYPYDEIDIVLGETGYGIAGMEYPGLVTSLPTVPSHQGPTPAINVVVHELAHQWWYGVVGNNQVKEPWLDEGLTTFSEFLYMQEKMNEDEKELLKKATLRTNEINQAVGVTSADSLYKYPDHVYGLMVYIRPTAMMYSLMDEIGRDQVIKIMRTYYETYQFQTATTQDFIKIANQVSGKNLTPFFQKWLYFKQAS
ncbi:M1 family metallopeptidase [Hazenella coriacea]|uniref:Peptidase M1-like protein n=1 Tax=Hazenella coriacea TaxID=1179467 RepID=A0A4R3L4M5_9BACL|nr:M1 family metallopeptidase [Hazenella coriacea]TCS94741.1 peptidase M1-like protein [Hazenella coriacea]